MSCSLDVADDGASTLDEVGQALGVTREAARQNEERALARLRQTEAVQAVRKGLDDGT